MDEEAGADNKTHTLIFGPDYVIRLIKKQPGREAACGRKAPPSVTDQTSRVCPAHIVVKFKAAHLQGTVCSKHTHTHTQGTKKTHLTELKPVIWNPFESNYPADPGSSRASAAPPGSTTVWREQWPSPRPADPMPCSRACRETRGETTPTNTRFYSITLAALGQRANTKESGFIKTISARREPTRLIYHQAAPGSAPAPRCTKTRDLLHL